MSVFNGLPNNPAELGMCLAQKMHAPDTGFEIIPEDLELITEFTFIAGGLGFVRDRYAIHAAMALSAPARVGWGDAGRRLLFNDVSFTGTFVSFSRVIFRPSHPAGINETCLSFEGVQLLPD